LSVGSSLVGLGLESPSISSSDSFQTIPAETNDSIVEKFHIVDSKREVDNYRTVVVPSELESSVGKVTNNSFTARSFKDLNAPNSKSLQHFLQDVSSESMGNDWVSFDISPDLSSTVIDTLESNPPSVADVKAGVECLSEDERLYGLISKGVYGKIQEQRTRDPEGYDATFSHVGVRLEEMMAKFQRAKAIAELASPSSIDKSSEQKDTWDALQRKYECSICLDVKAAPVILHCEHSFCGICIDNLLNSCVMLSPTPSSASISEEVLFNGGVLHHCPLCNSEINQRGIYERDADYAILHEVDTVKEEDSTEKKVLYHRKRNEFLKMNKERERRRSAEGKGTPRTEDSWGWAVPIIALAVLVVIAFLRK